MMKNGNPAFSIKMAFNLGVWMRQNRPGRDVFEIGRCLREIIYFNLDRPAEGQYDKEVVDANVDYLLEVSLLGYLMSGVCSYDPEIKERIPSLIEKRLSSEASPDTPQEYGGDVADNEDGDCADRVKAQALN